MRLPKTSYVLASRPKSSNQSCSGRVTRRCLMDRPAVRSHTDRRIFFAHHRVASPSFADSRPAGFGHVLRFLKARAASHSIVELHGVDSQLHFAAELKRLRDKRTASTTIYAVPEHLPWSENWVEEALDQIDSLRRRGRRDLNVRVLFMADPLHFWRLLAELQQLNHRGLAMDRATTMGGKLCSSVDGGRRVHSGKSASQ